MPFEIERGTAGASGLSSTLSKGQVRAGKVVAAGELLSGIKVEGKVGDFKIYNDRVAFIIASERGTNGYSPFGGELLDAQRVDDSQARSLIGETLLTIGAAVLEPTSVGVINDGSDGKPALVRVVGTPRTLPLIEGFIPISSAATPVHIVIDYSLAPDSDALESTLRLFNKTRKEVKIPLNVLGMLAGDGLDFFADGVGFDVGDGAAEQSYVGLVGADISYAIVGVGKTQLKPLISESGVWLVETGAFIVPAAGETSRGVRLSIGKGTPEALRAQVRSMLTISSPPALSGTVSDGAGAVAGAHVHAELIDSTDRRRYYSKAISDSSGHYDLKLPDGKYDITVSGDGRKMSDPVTVTVAGAAQTKDLSVGETATVQFEVKDDGGVSLPAKLTFVPKTALPEPPRSFGELRYGGGVARIVFHPGGSGTTTVPPGEYTITASRGFEYEVDTQTVTVNAGQTNNLTFTLRRSVSTPGYMSGDFHLHAQWSPDSNDLNTMKVTALAAEGVEIPVNTDHEYISNYNPAIAQMGLQKWVRGIVGEELTTFAYGHFNVYPIVADDSKPNNGAIPWIGRTPPELFSDVRKAFPDAVLQINHPRSVAISGYFSYVGLDPTNGTFTKPDAWSGLFNAIEVFNDSGWSNNKDGTVRDWFALLDRGKIATAIGNSDSHSAISTEVGYPRNFVALSTDEPANVNTTEMATSVKEGRVVVSGGIFIDVSANGKKHGDTITAQDGKVSLAIKVQAPAWVNADTLEVYVGGKVGGDMIATRTLDSSTADPNNATVRFDSTIDITVSKDTWIVVVAYGAGKLDPVVRGQQPFGVVNPIYVDVDGNGKYDPPLTLTAP
ncbi:MAG: CehA/McbA family metallohydrolase [Myxococcales bacterium]|nr:CehA/McbA family metallohydrolase [Myxococcales bacterium]